MALIVTTLALHSLIFGTPASAAHADDMIGISFSGNLYTLNSSTGTGSAAGTGPLAINAMAIHPSGAIYVAGSAGTLYHSGGVGSPFKLLGNLGFSVRGMAIDGANRMYAVTQSTPTDLLYQIDLNTLASALVGDTGLGGLQSLAISPGGTLYGWDLGPISVPGTGLNTIDSTTGAATDVNPGIGTGGGSNANLQFLTFAPDGTLFGGRDDLQTIDVSSGKRTVVGSGGYNDLRGADFTLSTPNCEAAAWGVYGFGVPGANGVPTLTLSAAPKLGTTPKLLATSSATGIETSILIVGFNPVAIPGSWGGDLLADPQIVLPLPIPAVGWSLVLPIPADPAICGAKVYMQLIQSDSNTAAGASSSAGLTVRVGI